LPNNGIEYYISKETIDKSCGNSGKPYIVSISGKTLDDNLKMLEMIASADKRIAAIELNLACPNVIGKPIIGYDFDQMSSVLDAVCSLKCWEGRKIPVGVKMPPYFDGPHYVQAANLINSHKDTIKYVACINTIGNSFAVDNIAEMPVISSNQGFAGLSGKAVKYVALANVKKMRELLHEDVDVVGVGGVNSGMDAFEMLLCGASAVQIGTCHWIEGPKCFDRIVQELRDIMQNKGYKTLEEFRGKLKTWNKEGASKSRVARKHEPTSGNELKISTKESSADGFMYVSAFLLLVVAALLAEKFGIVAF